MQEVREHACSTTTVLSMLATLQLLLSERSQKSQLITISFRNVSEVITDTKRSQRLVFISKYLNVLLLQQQHQLMELVQQTGIGEEQIPVLVLINFPPPPAIDLHATLPNTGRYSGLRYLIQEYLRIYICPHQTQHRTLRFPS